MAQPTEVRFELQRLALEGDELVVSGFWTGVHGMRFVRPTLLCDDRRILATLEHKPWTPSEDASWTAAFPWTGGGTVDAGSLALAVAPRVIVQLAETATDAPAPAKAATPVPAAKPAKATAAAKAATPVSAAKPAKATAAAKAATPAPDAKPAKATDAAKATPAAKRTPAAKAGPTAKSRRAARPTTAATPAPAPAAQPAPAPVPTSNGAPPPTPPVIPVDARSDDLSRALAAVERERDRALAERDEILIAYTALQRQLQAEHAQADRHARHHKDHDETDPDAPLGVRTVPAVRGILAELQYPPREPKRRLAAFDLWVVRVIGLAAAGCFLALLLSIVRVVS